MSQADYESLAAFRYALRQFLRFSEEAALQAGLTPRHHQALLAIKGYPGGEAVTVGALAERLQLRHHSTVELVDRLVAAKLLVRQQGPHDRRQVCLALTSRGSAVLEKLSTAHKEELRRLAPQFQTILEQLRSR